MQKDALASSPAIIVSGLTIAGISLNEWVVIGTLGLILLQGILLSRKIYLAFKKKTNKKKRRSEDG